MEKIFPVLTPAQINRIEAHGHVRVGQSGELLVEQGDTNVPFFVVITGELEIVRPFRGSGNPRNCPWSWPIYW